jgi:Lysozyme like domain
MYSQNQIAGLALNAGIPSSSLQIASAIAMAESGGDSNSVNPGGPGDPEYSVGLWQINIAPNAHPEYSAAQMKNPQLNAAAMFKISSSGTNWYPWGSYTNGSYKQFMLSPITPASTLTTSTTSSSSSQPTNVTSNPAVYTDVGSGFKYVLAYTIAIIIFILIAKFKAGYTAIYYALLLCLLFLLVTQAKFIYNALSPLFTQTGESNVLTTALHTVTL